MSRLSPEVVCPYPQTNGHGHNGTLSPPQTPDLSLGNENGMVGDHGKINGLVHLEDERSLHASNTWPRDLAFGPNHIHDPHESHPLPALSAHIDDVSDDDDDVNNNIDDHSDDDIASQPQSQTRPSVRHSYAGERRRARAFPRLSKPVELMRGEYDVVVIGSGYGGGVAASRMARTGSSVCLLERGREKWPGEYPVATVPALEEVHFSGEFAPGDNNDGMPVKAGDPTGMFHLILGQGQNAVVCNGLGGTSLMNANVFMEADRNTLAMKAWPREIRGNVDEMDKYYKKVEDVLEPEEYPDDWPKLDKLELLKKQAEAIGCGERFRKVRQTTRFRNGPNSCGVEMAASALTGQDCTGVNDGSKTTTLVTYLADAWNWGADMFCQCEVRHIERCRDGRPGYIVYFAWHGRNRGYFRADLHSDLMWVYAREAVFLGAGSIGTTEILLRSKAMGLDLSDQVGQNMSGNGDMLAFGYNTKDEVNAIGKSCPSPYSPVGPTINGVIDCREGHENPLDGFIIEEGAIPHALSPFLQAMLDLMPGRVGPKDESMLDQTKAALARYGSRFLGPYFRQGAIEKTQVYLIMSHDSNQATLSLKDDKPVLEFTGVGRSDHVKRLNEVLAKATTAVGGTLVQNPFFALMGKQEVTVHPIGGAHMARDGTGATGATNHAGEVFTGEGRETHEGLIVTDGAVIPTALGANPFATIAALAERSVEKYVERRRLVVDERPNGVLNLFGEPAHLPLPAHLRPKRKGGDDGNIDNDEKTRMITKVTKTTKASKSTKLVEEFEEETESINETCAVIRKAEATKASGFGFTEAMSGFIHYDEKMKGDTRETYELACRTAKSLCESARFFLSMQSFDTEFTVNDPEHRGMLTGTFVCPTIPGSPFMVQRGEFNLFVVDTEAPGTRNLTYDFDMRGVDGRRLHFHGYKVVDSSVALAPAQLWRATTTLYVTVSEWAPGLCGAGVDDQIAWRRAKVLAKGIMNVHPGDFLCEMMTMTPTGDSLLKKALSAAGFLTFFTRRALGLFLGPLTPLQYPRQTPTGFINNTPPDRSVPIYASDGVCTRLHIWEPTSVPNNDPAQIKNLFMVPGASVDHQIYALPTIPFNAVNYFTRAGYRVFVTVHRIGQLMVAENNWTTYDARLDLRACLEHIRAGYCGGGEEDQKDKVYTIAHCMGSVAFASGLLDGTIPASWILGITASQVFMNPIWGPLNMAKVRMGGPVPLALPRLYSAVAGSWFSCTARADNSGGVVQSALDQLLRLYPDSRRELCSSASCHRISLVFGRCWNHGNLNEATHRQIDRFFGGVSMRCESLLMRMGAAGHVMTNEPLHEPLTTPENIARLRGVPVMLFVGRDNAVLSTASTEKTYEVLCDTFGTGSGSGSGGEYRRRVVPGYGHLDGWMGRNAWKDVYPFVREEVDRVVRGANYRFCEPEDRFKRMVESGELC